MVVVGHRRELRSHLESHDASPDRTEEEEEENETRGRCGKSLDRGRKDVRA